MPPTYVGPHDDLPRSPLVYDEPQTLYRYSKKIWIEDLVLRGKLRLTTFYECRKSEDARCDPGENTLKFIPRQNLIVRHVDPLAPVLARYFKVNIRRNGVLDIEAGTELSWEPGDMWVYCTSERFDERLMEKFEKLDGACAKITEPVMFFRTLDEAVRRSLLAGVPWVGISPVRTSLMGRCIYSGRELDVDNFIKDPVRPMLLKPEAFKDEHEVRGVWVPTLEDRGADRRMRALPYVDIECPELTRCCVRYP